MLEFIKQTFTSYIFLIITTLMLFYIYLKKSIYSYFKTHRIPHDKPTIIIGTLEKELIMQKITMEESFARSYQRYRMYPLHGIYLYFYPIIMINDLDLMTDILIKNFQSFPDRGVHQNSELDPLSENLFFISGEKWKTIRAKSSSIFTPSKLKYVLPLLKETTDNAVDVINDEITTSDIFDATEFMEIFTLDIILSISFGFNFNILRNPDSIIRRYGNLALDVPALQSTLSFCAPQLLNIFRIPFFNREASDFFIKLFNDMVNKRKLETVKRTDLLNVLIDLMEHEQVIEDYNDEFEEIDSSIREKAKQKISRLQGAAIAFQFYLAGYESTAAVVTHCLHELVLNPDIQDEVHKELDEFLKSPESSNYENFMKLKYLDMVWNESLRKHAPVTILNRKCVKDYKVPNSNYVIPQGMRLVISVTGLHKNPDLYPDPEKFDPTRFTKEKMANMHPCQFLIFGAGPRSCIGKRFAVLMGKIILFSLLSNYRFSMCEKTPKSIEYKLKSFINIPAGPVYLRAQKKKP